MDNYIFPTNPADTRPDLSLWSGWTPLTAHLTTNPLRAPSLYAADMLECFCGTHVWVAADGRRWTHSEPSELHRCPDQETPLEAAEATFSGAWRGDGLDDAATAINDTLAEARRRYTSTPETLAEAPSLPDLVIE